MCKKYVLKDNVNIKAASAVTCSGHQMSLQPLKNIHISVWSEPVAALVMTVRAAKDLLLMLWLSTRKRARSSTASNCRFSTFWAHSQTRSQAANRTSSLMLLRWPANSGTSLWGWKENKSYLNTIKADILEKLKCSYSLCCFTEVQHWQRWHMNAGFFPQSAIAICSSVLRVEAKQ